MIQQLVSVEVAVGQDIIHLFLSTLATAVATLERNAMADSSPALVIAIDQKVVVIIMITTEWVLLVLRGIWKNDKSSRIQVHIKNHLKNLFKKKKNLMLADVNNGLYAF